MCRFTTLIFRTLLTLTLMLVCGVHSLSAQEENDKPVITGQTPLSFNEDGSFTLLLSHLTVTDPDNTYPDDFTLTILSGADYTVSGNTITPNQNFAGQLNVPVTVSDGALSSDEFTVIMQVIAVNDAPVITSQASLGTSENQSLTILLSHLTVTDPDDNYPEDFTLSVLPGTNYSVSGNTITPASGFSGNLMVPVSVNDGDVDSNPYNLNVAVSSTNDPPVITGHSAVQSNEDESVTISLTHLTVSDPDNSYPQDFTLTVNGGENFSVSGNIVTPSANFFGTLSVPVTVNDGIATSNTYLLPVTISPVNDPPVIDGQARSLQTNENEPITLTLTDIAVTDPDNDFPEDFSLAVADGENYSVSGTMVTPDANFNGTLSVPVTVSDGAVSSNPFSLQISVSSVNGVPVITGQTTLQTNEDTSLTILLENLNVTDTDNTYPNDFTLTVHAGTNYSVSGATITPTENYYGTLTVPVSVNDGQNSSDLFNLQIEVIPVNDPPAITGQNALATPEDTPVTLSVSHLVLSDPDNDPSQLTLTVNPGSNYTFSGSTITPAADFTGTLSVPLTVSDGVNTSNIFSFQLQVTDLDDAPVISGQQEIRIGEDQSVPLTLSQFTITDPGNPQLQGVSLIVNAGDHYSVSNNTITPEANFYGLLTVPVYATDGINNSNTFNTVVMVDPANDPPQILSQATLSTFKNTSVLIDYGHLSVSDVDNSYPTGFTISVADGDNYSVAGQSVLPAADFIGVLSVPVTVNDGQASSDVFAFKINVVAPPNVPPSIKSQVTLTTFEDQSLLLELVHFQVEDPDNEFPNDFVLQLSTGSNYTLSGNRVIPTPGFSGNLTVPARIRDKQDYSQWFNTIVKVIPVSEAPLITSQHFLRLEEDDSLTIDFDDLVVIDNDNDYPNGFTITLYNGENYSVDGRMIKPALNFNGYLEVPVTVNDGENMSPVYNALILVDAVNDEPALSDADTAKYYAMRSGPAEVFKNFVIEDPDSDTLTFAEIRITSGFESGKDTLIFQNTNAIRGVFDNRQGTLIAFGRSSLEEYQQFIRNIQYEYKGEDVPAASKTISVSVNDGESESEIFAITIGFDDIILSVDIPTGFTPNGDGVNDHWEISVPEAGISLSDAVLRVYNRRGILVFESTGLSTPWDGRMNGQDLPADSYFYTLDLNSSAKRNRYKGVITILR